MSYVPLSFDSETNEIAAIAEKELGETLQRREEALVHFRKTISDNGKLQCLTDDEFLLMFLRARKFNVQRAMELLQNFYQFTTQYQDVFRPLKFEVIEKSIKEKIINVLPYFDKDGCAVVICSSQHARFEEVSFSDMINILGIIELVLLSKSPTIQICGFKVIIDSSYLNITHLRYVTPRMIMIMTKALQNKLPIRYKAVHFITGSPLLDWIWTVVKPFMPKKLKNRCLFHARQDLTKFFDAAILPKEYGGMLDLDNEFCITLLKKCETRINEVLERH